MIDVRCRAEGSTVVLELVGALCLVTAPTVTSCIDGLLESPPDCVVIDLSEVSMFGSSAADLVIETARRLNAAGSSLSLRSPTGLTAYVIELLGLSPLIERVDEQAALV